MKKAEAYWPLILLLAIIKFVLPLFLQHSLYELQRDEYLYYEQGQHFALGYLENPPLIAYLGMISSWFGGSVAWIKLWPCLFGAGTVIITCLLTAELGGKLFAQFIAGLGIIGGAYLRVHFLLQPNFLDIFFWTLSVYFLIRYINSNNQQFIYWLAVSLAVGWWGKYSILFMVMAIAIGLLLSPYRNLLVKRQTWLAAGIALLIIAPNILWQYWHNWPLIHHMQELQETQLKYIDRVDFLKNQLLMLLPVAAIWIAGLVWVLRKKEYRIIGIIYLSVIALLMLGSGKDYYALGSYPMLLAAGGVIWENWSERKKWIRYVLVLFIIGLNYLVLPMLLPIWKPEKLAVYYKKLGIENTWEDQKNHPLPQDFADMLGWKELTNKTETFYTSLPDSTRKVTTIYCRHYGMAGSLKFYSNDTQLKEKVITDNGSFLLWIPTEMKFKNLLFLGHRMPDKDDEVFQHFEKITVIDSVTNPLSRQFGDKIIFFENIDAAGLQAAIAGLNEMKKEFNR